MVKRMGPGDVPKPAVKPVTPEYQCDIDGHDIGCQCPGRVSVIPDEAIEAQTNAALDRMMIEGLAKLREPFPRELIEHLPKQKWKKAWEDQPYQNCDECGGYHPLGRGTIHLDYVGHAGVTSRLLEVDPFWEWEPVAWTPEGLPKFDGFGGLWIRLTVCGVTRLGYGDAAGKQSGTTAVKEIIGDAIRNAAMRFGVALDLWSKADLHSNINPGAIDEASRGQSRGGSRGRAADDDRPRTRVRDRDAGIRDGQADQGDGPRAPNQDALDSLGSVCDDNGLDRRTMRDTYAKWAASKRYKDRELLTADSERIIAFAAHLLEGLDGPDGDEQPPAEGSGDDAGDRAGEPADDAGAGVGQVASDDGASLADEAQAAENMF